MSNELEDMRRSETRRRWRKVSDEASDIEPEEEEASH